MAESFAEIAALEQPPPVAGGAPAPPAPAPATQTMYDGDGKPVEVPLDQVKTAFKAGLGFGDGDTVHLSQGGEVKAFSGKDAAGLLDSPVGQVIGVASGQQFAAQEEEKAYGTTGAKAQAFAAGLARGATFGGSDALLTEAGVVEREHLQKLQGYRPGYSMAGEVASLFVPFGAPALVGKGARAAAGVAERLPGIVGRVAGGAVAGGLEMGAVTAGQEYSRQVLANEGLSGEKLAAAFAHGAAFGAAGGAAVPVVASVGSAVVGKALDAGTSLAERITGATAKATAEEAVTLGQKGARLLDATTGGLERAAAEAQLARLGADGKAVAALRSSGAEVEAAALRQAETLQGLKATEARVAAAKASAEKAGAELAAVEKKIASEAPKAELGKLGAEFRAENSLAGLGQGPARGYLTLPADQRAMIDLGRQIAQVERVGLGDAAAVVKVRERLVQLGQSEGMAGKLAADFNAKLEAELARVSRAAEEKLGGEVGQKLAAAQVEAKAARWHAEVAEKEAARGAPAQGLSGKLGALTGSNVGGEIGGAIAGAPGRVVGNIAGALVEKVATPLREQAAASILRRTAESGDLLVGAVRAVDDVVGARVGALLRRGAISAAHSAKVAGEVIAHRPERPPPTVQGYRAQRAQVEAAAKDPSAHAASVVARLPPGTPPGMARAAAQTAQRGAAYLQQTMPRGAGAGATLQPQFDKSMPSQSAIAEWHERVGVVADPSSVIEDAARGRVSQAQADTLRAVYPEMFASLQTEIRAGLRQMDEPLEYDQALALGRLFGVAAHPSQTPEFIATMQGVWEESAGSGGGGGGPPAAVPRRQIKISRQWAIDGGAET